MSIKQLTADVYNIGETINKIQRKFNTSLSTDTLSMGVFGHITEALSDIGRDSITASSEYGNEAVYLRSKFEKTIYANALFYNIKDINAIPSEMKIMFGFIESELAAAMGNKNYIIIDKDTKILFDEYEFHLDYDLHISRTLLKDGRWAYSARYIIDRINPISDIKNAFLPSPTRMTKNYSDFLFLQCTIHQVYHKSIEDTIKTDNFIYNKTYDFTFNNIDEQLSYFTVCIEYNNKKTYLTPVFDNMPSNNDLYCNYLYLDENTIRIKFNEESYSPQSTAKIYIELYTTSGSKGNFSYNDEDGLKLTLSSVKYGYDNLNSLIRTAYGYSENGVDAKSIDDLKKLIPKEVLSRGGIINTKDIENYFYNLDSTRLYFYKKRHNQLERLYYSYMLMMNADNNIIPTNTIDLFIPESGFNIINDNRYILTQGSMIQYDSKSDSYKLLKGVSEDDELEIEKENFVYSIPFTMVVNTEPTISTSYYSTNISNKYDTDYNYINLDSTLQFICNYIQLDRNFKENNDNYIITANISQNILENFEMVTFDKDNPDQIASTKLKVMLVIYDEKKKYYVNGYITDVDLNTYTYTIQFVLDNDNMMDKMNRIRINKIIKNGTDFESYSYFPQYINMKLFVYTECSNNEVPNHDYGLEYFTTEVENYTLTNIFNISNVKLFENYSDNINTVAKVLTLKDNTYGFNLRSIPVVKYSYINNINRFKELLNYIALRKAYIDDATVILENSFSVDLKFFNTYGKSKLFEIGYNGEKLDKINLTLNFRVKLLTEADANTLQLIKDSIKDYIEDINKVDSIHMNNVCSSIKEDFKSNIDFIEFVGINNYNANYQYIKKLPVDELDDVPEFINVNCPDGITPEINIESV